MVTTVVSTFVQCALLLMLPSVDGYTDSDVRRLVNDTLGDYDIDIRPIVNQSEPVVVNFSMSMFSIMEFDEVRGEISINAAVGLIWKDEFINWSPFDYGYLYSLVLPVKKFWVPSLVIRNAIDEMATIGGKAWHKLRVAANGNMYYFPVGLLKATCSADVTYYPFDTHVCVYAFSSDTYSSAELLLSTYSTEIGTEYYQETGAWTLGESSIQLLRDDSKYLNVILVGFSLSRKSGFITVNFIVPIIFLGLLNVVIFCIPSESGEKISYSITMLLAIAVFLTLVSDNLPQSLPLSYFSFYLISILVISVLIIFITVFNLRIFHRDDEKVPVSGSWLKLANFWKCRCHSLKKIQEHDIHEKSKEIKTNKTDLSLTTKKSEIAWTSEDGGENLDNEHQVKWKNVSDAIDKTCFVIFTVAQPLGIVIYFAIVKSAPNISVQQTVSDAANAMAA